MQATMIEGIYVIPTLTQLNQIKAGDVVLHNEELKTVPSWAIVYDSFMGVCIWNDSYHIKRKMIKCKIWNGLRFVE